MKHGAVFLVIVALAVGAFAGGSTLADQFEVTVTNLTRGQQFTPILVASHRAGTRLFQAGGPASEPLEELAEGGATGPLEAALLDTGMVLDTNTSVGLLDPGGSVTLRVETSGRFNRVSVASMLIPTNDTFLAVNGVRGPMGKQMLLLDSPGYDAGTENNDELCASIPGPVCGGAGFESGGGEGFVHVSSGIQDVGDLIPAVRDWRNPVARITIKRVSGDDDEDLD